MKKFVCLAVSMLVLLGCLTGCNLTQKVSGAIAGEAEATPKVEEMMNALADADMSGAKSLMHPQVSETSGDAITQMSNYIAGRKVDSMELKSVNINTSTGTSGKTRQENLTYQVTLDDAEIIYLNTVYFSDSEGAGFVSFQIVMGVV